MFLLLSACTASASDHSGSRSSAGATGPASTHGGAPTGRQPAWYRVKDVLDAMHASAFNPSAPSEAVGAPPGGLYINWRPGFRSGGSAGTETDINENGLSDAQEGKPPRHDPLTDLYYLVDLTGWAYAHPGEHSYDADIARMRPIVAAEFSDYRYYRSFVYFELLDLERFDPGRGWGADALRFARNLQHFWDPSAGQFIDPRHMSYTVSYAAESAAVYADAARRFGVAQWAAIGRRAAVDLISTCADPATGLLPGTVSVTATGQRTSDPRARVGEEAQTLDALLDVYDTTGDGRLLVAVEKAVDSLYNPRLGVLDPVHGGFFFAVNYDGTGLDAVYKETRQAWMLPLLVHLEAIDHRQAARIAAMEVVVSDRLWQASSGGYPYRVDPGFGTYHSHEGPGHQPVSEDYISSEAMGIAVQALELQDLRV